MEFLPEDMLLEICSWLSSIDILALRSTCREYSVVTRNNLLWCNVVDRDFCNVSSDSLEPMHETQYQRLLNISRQPQSLTYAVTHNYLDAIKYLLDTKYLLITVDKIPNNIIDTMLRVGNLKVLQLPPVHNMLLDYKFSDASDITNVAVLDWLTLIGVRISSSVLVNIISIYTDNIVLPVLQWFIKHNILPATIAKILVVYNHKQSLIALINSGYTITARTADIACRYGQLAILKRYGHLPTATGLNYAYGEDNKYLLPWLKRNGIVADDQYMRLVIEADDLLSLQLFASNYQFTLTELIAVIRDDVVEILHWLLEQGIAGQIVTKMNTHQVPESGVDSIIQWAGSHNSTKILNYLMSKGLVTPKGMTIVLFEIIRQPLMRDWLLNQVHFDKQAELQSLINKVSVSGWDNYQESIRFFSICLL